MMKTRMIELGKIVFPEVWIEFNPQYAKNAMHVAICTDGVHVGIYYTQEEASKLSKSQMENIDAYAGSFGFAKDYRVYGIIEQDVIDGTLMKNVGNAELVRD
jgi:hypothetical protein